MSDYKIWRCTNCETSIVTITEWHDVECCESPSIIESSQCARDSCDIHHKIELPDHDDRDLPEPAPEPPRPSRIELVLQDLEAIHG